MTQQSKYKGWAIPALGAAAVLSLGLFAAGCGSGGGGTTAAGTTSTSVGGTASKGPFYQTLNGFATTVTAKNLAGTTVATGTVNDNYGAYTIDTSKIKSTDGLLIVDIYGYYFDEYTGAASTNTGTVSVTLDAATIAGKSSVKVYPSVATTIATNIIKKSGTAATASTLAAAKTQVAQALGLSATADIDTLNSVDMYAGGDATKQADVTKMLTLAAAVGRAVKAGSAIDTVLTNLTTDLYTEAKLIGSKSSAAVDLSKIDIKTIAMNLDAYVDTTSTGGKSTYSAFTAAASTFTAARRAVATAAATAKVVDVYGFATVSDTAGTSNYTTFSMDSYGKATVQTSPGNTPYNNVIIGIMAGTKAQVTAGTKDYYVEGYDTSNGDIYASVTFDVKDAATGGKRAANVTLSQVKVALNSTNTAIQLITVPAGATLTVNSATDSNGNTVTVSQLTNVSADTSSVFAISSGNVAIDISKLLSVVQTKANNTALNVLNTAGTYDFSITFNGVNLGQGGKVFSAISGTITTK